MKKYFSEQELMCNCGCGQNKITQEALDMINRTRSLLGSPIYLNSAYRCENHPESQKSPTSSHIKGVAFDIRCESSLDRYSLIALASVIGFKRIGIAKGFIHVDCDKEKVQNVIWVY